MSIGDTFGQLVEYITEAGVRHVDPAQHALDSVVTLAAVQADYNKVAGLGRHWTLDAAALSAVQAAASVGYAADVIEHEVTGSDPAAIVDHLAAVRSYPDWAIGLVCTANVTTVFYAGTLWVCRVSHTVSTDPNWRPDVAPNLWRKFYDPADPAWSYPTAYQGDNTAGAGNGDVVMYNGRRYRCLQSHTSNSAWYPSAVGVINVLWVDVGAI